MVTPVTHAIVSIFIRLYSSIDSLTPIDFPWSFFVGVFAFLVGVYLYYFQNQSINKVWIALKFILLFYIAFLLVKKFDEGSDLPSKSIDLSCQKTEWAKNGTPFHFWQKKNGMGCQFWLPKIAPFCQKWNCCLF